MSGPTESDLNKLLKLLNLCRDLEVKPRVALGTTRHPLTCAGTLFLSPGCRVAVRNRQYAIVDDLSYFI